MRSPRSKFLAEIVPSNGAVTNLAYGPRAMGTDIPANSTLLIRVELLAVSPVVDFA